MYVHMITYMHMFMSIGAVTSVSWSNCLNIAAVSSSRSHLYIYSLFVKSLSLQATFEETVHTEYYYYILLMASIALHTSITMYFYRLRLPVGVQMTEYY